MSTRSQLSASPTPVRAPLPGIELFKSQGCSFYPRVQALLSELAIGPDLLSRGFDYGCWIRRQDTYACELEGSGFRQKFVIEGQCSVAESCRAVIAATSVQAKAKARPAIEPSVPRRGDRIPISDGFGRGMTQVLVTAFNPATPTAMGPDENAGRAIEQADSRQFHRDLGSWEGWSAGPDAPPFEEEGPAMVWQQAGSWINDAARVPPSA